MVDKLLYSYYPIYLNNLRKINIISVNHSIDDNLIEDDKVQFNNFYEALVNGKNKNWLQESSLDTWILLEACNESARKNKKISVKEIKKSLIK